MVAAIATVMSIGAPFRTLVHRDRARLTAMTHPFPLRLSDWLYRCGQYGFCNIPNDLIAPYYILRASWSASSTHASEVGSHCQPAYARAPHVMICCVSVACAHPVSPHRRSHPVSVQYRNEPGPCQAFPRSRSARTTTAVATPTALGVHTGQPDRRRRRRAAADV